MSLSLSSSVVDFIHGDSLLQSFELGEEFGGGEPVGTGDLVLGRRWLDDPSSDFFGQMVKFVVDRVTVTPGRCTF